MRRNPRQKLIDAAAFPIRALILIEKDRWGLSSLATERYDYVSREVVGRCLDVGCGRYNRFISEFMNGEGIGIDVYPYDGLTKDQIIEDISCFPFDDEAFDSVTFIANINHIPRSARDIELAEAFRCVREGGNIVVTMGNPVTELLVHKLVWLYDALFKTRLDMDSERGMHEEESYYLSDREIVDRLRRAGFTNLIKKYFWTQWGLNHLFVGWKTGGNQPGYRN